MEVTNDPRMMAANVLFTRLNAFHVMAVCCVLTSNLSCAQMLAAEKVDYSDGIRGTLGYLAFFMMAVVFVMNLSAAIIILQQLFHMQRLSTAGATGFEHSRSYYLNLNVLKLRHFAARLFFASFPLYLFCVGLAIYIKGGGREKLPHTIWILLIFWVGTAILACITCKQTDIFKEKYAACHDHESPLRTHLMTMPTATNIDPYNIV